MGAIFNEILIRPIVNILLLFYYLLSSLGVPGAFGFSIIGLTVFIRLLLHPLFHQQLMMAKKMEKVKPHLDRLSKQYKDDKKRLQEEQLKLYKEMGVNPASGCVAIIIQIPIFIALYQVLSLFLLNGGMTKLKTLVEKIVYADFLKISQIDPNFFGFNLGIAPSQFQKYGIYYLALPVITAILQYYQVAVATPAKKNIPGELAKKDDSKKEGGSEDMQKIMSTQMKYMFPLMIGWFSYTLPIGLSLYWNIFSIFSIIQYKKKIDI